MTEGILRSWGSETDLNGARIFCWHHRRDRRSFGSVRVAVTVRATSWRTSLFPDTKTEAYMLPVEKAVRVAEHLETGDEVRARLQVAYL